MLRILRRAYRKTLTATIRISKTKSDPSEIMTDEVDRGRTIHNRENTF